MDSTQQSMVWKIRLHLWITQYVFYFHYRIKLVKLFLACVICVSCSTYDIVLTPILCTIYWISATFLSSFICTRIQVIKMSESFVHFCPSLESKFLRCSLSYIYFCRPHHSSYQVILHIWALLNKWLWRFGMQREAIWRGVVAAKYGEDHFGWTTRDPRGAVGCSVWKGIVKGGGYFPPRLGFGLIMERGWNSSMIPGVIGIC